MLQRDTISEMCGAQFWSLMHVVLLTPLINKQNIPPHGLMLILSLFSLQVRLCFSILFTELDLSERKRCLKGLKHKVDVNSIKNVLQQIPTDKYWKIP